MTRQGQKQVESVVAKINEQYEKWLKEVDFWTNHQDRPLPSLPKMVEDLLNHLRGLDAKKASEFEWMMIV